MDREKSERLDKPVFCCMGESGTGRKCRPLDSAISELQGPTFVTITGPPLPIKLVESELFRARQRAFTGATGTNRVCSRFGRTAGPLFMMTVVELPLAVATENCCVFSKDGSMRRIGSSQRTSGQGSNHCGDESRSIHSQFATGQFSRGFCFTGINVLRQLAAAA